MDTLANDAANAPAADMIRIPGGTFRMGSDRHYPEEAPAHSVTVDGFWIDPAPLTNAPFRKFIEATGYVTWAEIAPDPKDYPGALPHMLKAGGLVFTPPGKAVDLADWSQGWRFTFGAKGGSHLCAPAIASATVLPRAMPSRSIRQPAMSASAASSGTTRGGHERRDQGRCRSRSMR